MVKLKFAPFVFALVAWLIVACGPAAPAAPSSGYGPLNPPGTQAADLANQATIAAGNSQSLAATAIAISAAETRTAEIATGQALATAGQSTAVAQATATGYVAQVQQTTTALALQATGQYLNQQATFASQVGNSTATIEAAAAGGTAAAISQAAVVQSQMATAEAERLRLINEANQATIERKRIWTYTLVLIVLLLVLVGIIGLVYFVWYRTRPFVVKTQPNEQLVGREGWRVMNPTPRLIEQSPEPLALPAPANPLPEAANWRPFLAWRQPGLIPIGANPDGPILLNLDKTPHVLFIGKTGSGKTRRGLWVTVAGAVANGFHVIVVNGKAADYLPFHGQPNVTLLRASFGAMPTLAGNVLEAMMREMERRDEILAQEGISTWSRLPADRHEAAEIMVVMDEFLELARNANPEGRRLMELAITLTSQGRKYGLCFVAALTNPTERAIGQAGLTVRDNCGRICFPVNDEVTARLALGQTVRDAGKLGEGHFISSLNGEIRRGVSFRPADSDIYTYLSSRPVRPALLPASIQEAAQLRPGNGQANGHEPIVQVGSLAAADARRLAAERPDRWRSRHQVAKFLAGRDDRANSEDYGRADEALNLLAGQGVEWASHLLSAN